MFTGLATSIYRTLSRHKLYTVLNLFGLALGIAVFLTMALIVRYEYGYDADIPHAAQIYQVDELAHVAGRAPQENSTVSFVSFPFLKVDFPEIAASIRVLQEPLVVRVGNTVAREQVTFTDRSFFSVFDLPLVAGNKDTALNGPGKVVISAAEARKYFGTTAALGRKLQIDNERNEAVVTGVLADPPTNRSMAFDIIGVTPTSWFTKPPFTNWGSEWGTMWVRINNPQAALRVNYGLAGYAARHPGNWTADTIREAFGDGGLELVPLRAVHFHSAAIGDGGNNRTLVDILGFVGIAALTAALINYINLATARSVLRARDIAMRKVLGATRFALAMQLIVEAVVLVALAGLAGLALTELSLHWVNEWGGWRLGFDLVFMLPITLVIVLLTGVLAGGYPALVLSAYQPAPVLAASKTPAGGRIESLLRSVLVVLQFSFAITLAICTLVMTQQASHVRRLDRGMNSGGLILIPSLADATLQNRQSEIMRRLAAVPGVTIATRSDVVPHNLVDGFDWRRPGHADKHELRWGKATEGYFEAIGAHVIAGRLFDREHGQDYTPDPMVAGNGTSVVISRLTVERLGFASPQAAVGQEVQEAAQDSSAQVYRIIGVVDDIRFRSARSPMAPLLYYGTNGPISYVWGIVRYSGASEQVENARLRAAWAEIAPNVAFTARTANDVFAEDYRTDASHGALFGIGSAIAIGIACLGLYGLSTFTATRRMQEIGIRKVLGARTQDILMLLIGQFLRPVLIATFLAWPLAWVLMRAWLSGFDERIGLTPLPFVAVTLIAVGIAAVTILGQTARAASQPPAAALNRTA
jgi:putative ABC transport system permease protein